MCIFSRQDLTRDPPLARMDLISCRNLLIYLGPVLQRRVMAIFGYALKPGGFLMLGNSEAVGSLSASLKAVDAKHKIYRRSGESAHPFLPDLPPPALRLPIVLRPQQRPDESTLLSRAADRVLLDEYAPPGFLLDSERRLVNFRGNVAEYLSTPRPGANLDVLSLVRAEVLAALLPALDAAMVSGTVARGRFISGEREVEVIVRPITEPRVAAHFLIVFEPAGLRAGGGKENRSADVTRSVEDLALDLASTRSYMQRLVEDLRSVNEEAQSANEELQSANEELQTAKEELQSSNEELATTNEEMQSRNTELHQVNADLVNLLSSLQVSILMLDRDLRVRRYTPVCEKLFSLIPGDIGRPITDLKAAIDIPGLFETLRQVIASGAAEQRDVRDPRGHWYSLRIEPYRTGQDRIDGVVLQMFDVDALKRSMEEVSSARDYAHAIISTVREALVVLDSDLRVRTVNRSYVVAFGEETGGTGEKSFFDLSGGAWDSPEVRAMLGAAASGVSPAPPDVEIEHRAGPGEQRTFVLNARAIGTSSILVAIEDISDRKRSAEAKFRRLFEHSNDGILLVDASTGVVGDVNPAALALLGADRDDTIGRNFWEVLPSAGGETEGRASLERLRASEMVRFPEVEIGIKGSPRVVEILANRYGEGDREVIQLNLRDITQRRRFERQLQETAKLESLGLLAGGIAHDFNNLLASIMGNASLALLDASAAPRYQTALRDVVRASQRAAELTSQMLAYAGKGRYVVRPVDMSEMVRDIATLVLTSVPKQVTIQMDLAAGLPPVRADVSQLQQVIMNLIVNGAESVGGKGVRERSAWRRRLSISIPPITT